MKKILTASLVAIMAVTAANAEIASVDYVGGVIGGLDVTDAAKPGQYVSAVSEENGKITVTRADLPTVTHPTVADTAVAGEYVSQVTQTDGAIDVTRVALPSVTDTEVEGQYVSEVDQTKGTISVTRKALPSQTDSAVAGQYVSAVSQANGKISVTRADLPTVDDALSDTSTNAVQNKVVKNALDKKEDLSNKVSDYKEVADDANKTVLYPSFSAMEGYVSDTITELNTENNDRFADIENDYVKGGESFPGATIPTLPDECKTANAQCSLVSNYVNNQATLAWELVKY